MTETQKIIKLILPELLAWIAGHNCSELERNKLDKENILSIHTVKKGV